MYVLLTAVNIIRGVRACVRAVITHIYAYTIVSIRSSVSHASRRTLNSLNTRTTCMVLDEPKQTSASEEARQGDEEEGTTGGEARGERAAAQPANPPPHTY